MVVLPGKIYPVSDDQVHNICGCGPFVVIAAPHLNKKPNVIKKDLKKEEDVVKVIKQSPIVEPVVEEEVVVEPEVEEPVVEEAKEVVEDDEPIVVEADKCVKKFDYTSIRKADLKEMCRERVLHLSGNRDDLIARLVAFDKGIIIDE